MSDRSNKDKAMAAYLRERGVRRTSGSCPWGCGHLVSNGGEALLGHLNVCRGKTRGAGR